MATTILAPSPALSPLCPHRRTSSSLTHRPNMISSLKHKLSSRKSSNSSNTNSHNPGKTHHPSTLSPTSMEHPQRGTAPSTRRPSPGSSSSNNPFRDIIDAPPAYTPSPAPDTAPVVPTPPLSAPSASTTAEARPAPVVADDPYAFLSSFDTIILVDDSGSMAGGRWRETGAALEAITPICTAHDADGIDIHFLNHPDSPFHHNVQAASTVREIFQTVRPRAGTPTGQRLQAILQPYLRRYEARPDATKPINLICITDGEPSDDVESPLIHAAKKLDRLDAPAWQVGVQFFQVGRDEQASQHLRQLDDELADISGHDDLRDIVDTVPFTGAHGTQLTADGILKVVLGAVNRRLDRKRSKDLHR